MSIEERRRLIGELETARSSRVISYVLSDRETFPAQIPGFNPPMTLVHPYVRDLLREIGSVDRLDLFLYTRGGAIESVWPLVGVLRQHCKTLAVLVPSRAHSAGTLICLGADEVIMGDSGELSPIDPTTGNQFNPRDPSNPASQLGISVEDVAAYFDLARDLAGVRYEDHKVEVLKLLIGQVHPLALGNVQRVYLLIRRLARELLNLHSKLSDEERQRAVEGLTTRFYTHLHSISRREAEELLGKMIAAPKAPVSEAMDNLFDAYVADMSMLDRYDLPVAMGNQPQITALVCGGLLESRVKTYANKTDLHIAQRPLLPPGVQVQLPPGGALPLEPWVGRQFDWGIQSTGWNVEPEEGQA
jgi:hypothetical protein